MPIMAARIIGMATGGTGNRKARSVAPGFLLAATALRFIGCGLLAALWREAASDGKRPSVPAEQA
jgi:hypothetical protein